MDKGIRLLKANEIEVRVQSVKEAAKGVGAILLLYKNARVDMNILDEIYGPKGWQREHGLINGNLFCTVSIWDDDKKQWIKKQDVGTENITEKQKSEASDSFKRACVNVGIGRELYTSPFIWVNLSEGEYNKSIDNKTKKEKYTLSPVIKFTVKSIEYSPDKEISKLEIIDNKHRVRYPSKGTTTQNNSSNNNQNIQENANSNSINTAKCVKCGTPISEKVAKFSRGKYKKVLCMNCQKLEK